MIEPVGILTGRDAVEAVRLGVGQWLGGGPAAFTMVRRDGSLVEAREVAADRLAPFITEAPDWAGLGPGPVVMGILNVTPDSFSDGGTHAAVGSALAGAERMLADGAQVIDVGGESTRPGAQAVPADLEQARVLPVVAALARQGAVVSIDTRNAGTMARALDAGARIVNDVSAPTYDAAALPLVVARGCPVVLMHMRGTPATMRDLAVYEDVVSEVIAELGARLDAAVAAGVRRAAIAVDPGFGFAKTAEHNLVLMQRLPALLGLGCAIVSGMSRKNTIGMLSGESEAVKRVGGSVAAALFALERGARVVRVHDVAETVQAVRVWRGLCQGQSYGGG